MGVNRLMDKQKKGHWTWKCRLIDSDISWKEYKDKYWQCTWKPKLTDKSGQIRL